MGRRKKTDEPDNGVQVQESPENGHTPAPEDAKKRPAASFKARSDRTTSIEVTVWGNQQEKDGEKWTQFTIAIKRQWEGADGWHDGGSYRAHDVPVLMYLIDRAYQFCIGQRAEVKLAEEVPF